MPELPEIETVKLQLQKVLVGSTIDHLEVLKERSVQGNWDLVKGKRVLGIQRKGKMLIIDLEGEIDIAIHFKMTGQLVYEPTDKHEIRNSKLQTIPKSQILNGAEKEDLHLERVVGGHPTKDFYSHLPSKHTRAIFHFTDGAKMYFNDQRMFGWVKIDTKEKILKMKFLESLGPEPFELTRDEFIKLIEKSKRPIKLVLMDQTVISGVGNIYANDALWEARTDPRRAANTLTRKQYEELYLGVIGVLKDGIKYGGATAADAKYIDLHGLGGHYQEHYRTYDREGEVCLRNDGGIIHKVSLGGRGTYFCPKCQK